ncbi:hypothetical protein GLP25_05690 [Photobacterium phosphoreum]|uniref:hypothetical protein n=1 Tax=Photobacterium phosphoreum TaxID=659 RepID=UPI001E60F644|nr:hypothetical protein [Photobacterium phosphoreum]MCD9482676.1 hypothetical protein [Photobacterium phosphoreum]
MSNTSSKKVTTIAGGSAALLGALALDASSNFNNPMLKEYAQYAVPGLTVFAAYIINTIGNLGSMSISGMLAIFSSGPYIRELKTSLSDPHISEAKKKQLQQEYEDAISTKLAIFKGLFSLFSSANQQAAKKATEQLTPDKTRDKETLAQMEMFQSSYQQPSTVPKQE